MPVAESAREALYARLQDVLGSEQADTLMTYLPQESSDQLATKSDIAAVRSDIATLKSDLAAVKSDLAAVKSDIHRIEERFDRLYETIIEQQKYYARTTVWSMVGLTAIYSLVVGFFA